MASIPKKKNYLSPLKELANLRKRIKIVKKQIAAEPPTPRNPPRQPLWLLLKAHLENAQASPMPFERLLQAMIDAGHELGRYPRRSVKQCVVSPHLRTIFEITLVNDVEMIGLRAGSGTIPYAARPQRLPQIQQAKPSPRPAA